MNHQGTLHRDAISQIILLLQAKVKASKADATIGNLQGMLGKHTNQSLMASSHYTSTTSSS